MMSSLVTVTFDLHEFINLRGHRLLSEHANLVHMHNMKTHSQSSSLKESTEDARFAKMHDWLHNFFEIRTIFKDFISKK